MVKSSKKHLRQLSCFWYWQKQQVYQPIQKHLSITEKQDTSAWVTLMHCHAFPLRLCLRAGIWEKTAWISQIWTVITLTKCSLVLEQAYLRYAQMCWVDERTIVGGNING